MALYFALRNREKDESEYAEVWGVYADALMERACEASHEADDRVREHEGQPKRKGGRASFRPEDTESSLQAAQRETGHLEELVRNALSPCGARREHYNSCGFVSIAQPTTQNPRLASQQGAFLFNGAERCTFEESLKLMMKDVSGCWYKRFRVPAAQLWNIEEQLFNFNIHDLSLFPDTEGLAGFVKQKLRLGIQ